MLATGTEPTLSLASQGHASSATAPVEEWEGKHAKSWLTKENNSVNINITEASDIGKVSGMAKLIYHTIQLFYSFCFTHSLEPVWIDTSWLEVYGCIFFFSYDSACLRILWFFSFFFLLKNMCVFNMGYILPLEETIITLTAVPSTFKKH